MSDGRSSVAYIPDHQPTAAGWGPEGWGHYDDRVLDLVSGADLLVHDAQFSSDELPAFHQLGPQLRRLRRQPRPSGRRPSRRAVPPRPGRSDAEVDRLVAAARRPDIEVFGAAQDTSVELPAPAAVTSPTRTA